MQSSQYLSSSQSTPYSSDYRQSLLMKPGVSPAILLWMQGASGPPALDRESDPRYEIFDMRRWKIAAVIVTLFWGGIAIAGVVSREDEFGSAIESLNIHESGDFNRRQISPWIIANYAGSTAVHERSNSKSVYASVKPALIPNQDGPVTQLGSPLSPLPAQEEYHGSLSYSHTSSLSLSLEISTVTRAGPLSRPPLPRLSTNSSHSDSMSLSLSLPPASRTGPTSRPRLPLLSTNSPHHDSMSLSVLIPPATHVGPSSRPRLPRLSTDLSHSNSMSRQPSLWVHVDVSPRPVVVKARPSSAYSNATDNYQRYLNRYSSEQVASAPTVTPKDVHKIASKESAIGESSSAPQKESASSAKRSKPKKSVKIRSRKMTLKKASQHCWNRIWRCY